MPDPLWRADTARIRHNASKTTKFPPEREKSKDEGEKRIQRIQRERAVIHAFLNASGQAPVKAANAFNDPPCYAIIGRGFAATVDHATLVQSKWSEGERLVNLKIQHIGYPDPWLSYHPHNMNQELELLTLPGYSNQPDKDKDDTSRGAGTEEENYRWLKSTSFARINRLELAGLITEPAKNQVIGPKDPLPTVHGMVSDITKDEVSGNYVISLRDSPVTITAAKIDICTGPGQSRTKFPAPGSLTAELTTRRRAPWVPRLYTSTNITLENAKMATGGLVLVRGAGPAAAQAVERALEEGAAQILWIGKDINSSFPGTLRLDWLVKTKIEDGELPPRDGSPAAKVNLSPTRENLWIADGYEIASMEEIQKDDPRWTQRPQWIEAKKVLRQGLESDGQFPVLIPTVLVKFERMRDNGRDGKPHPSLVRDPACRNSECEAIDEIVYGLFHQVIVATGLEDSEEDVGSGFGFAQTLGAASKHLMARRVTDGEILVGFESEDKRIRWLGAAGHGSKRAITTKVKNLQSGKDEEVDLQKAALQKFEKTLPAQARIFQQSVTLCALTVAFANRWFARYHKRESGDRTVNHNVNTASHGELVQLTSTYASEIHEIRIKRTRPFKDLRQVAQAVIYYQQYKNNDNFYKTIVTDADLQKIDDDFKDRVSEVWKTIKNILVVKYVAAEYGDRRF
jgi:hypothetical protein